MFFGESLSGLVFVAELFIPCSHSSRSCGIYVGQESCSEDLHRNHFSSLPHFRTWNWKIASHREDFNLSVPVLVDWKYTTFHFCINLCVSIQYLNVHELSYIAWGGECLSPLLASEQPQHTHGWAYLLFHFLSGRCICRFTKYVF